MAQSTWTRVRNTILLVVLAPVWIPILILVLVLWAAFASFSWVRGHILRGRFRRRWGSHGKDILLVYSNSPNWQEYIEQNWLPWLGERAVVINWSERAQWRRTVPLESSVFRHFAGDREFNPCAIHVPVRGRVTVIRFWQAFQDLKHGKDGLLRKQEARLRELVDAPEWAAV